MTHLTPIEYKVVYCIQRLNDIVILLLPWLKRLAVIGFFSCAAGLVRWNVNRLL